MTLPETRATIEVLEPAAAACPRAALPPEGHVKLRNYRVLSERLRAYSPASDAHAEPAQGKLAPRWELAAGVPPRARILELVCEGQPGHAALAAIVRPAPRAAPRGLARPLDEDARRFLERALPTPSPSLSATPEPAEKRPALPSPELEAEVSLADELREAEKGESWRMASARISSGEAAAERARPPGPEAPGDALCAVARRLDALLAESRALHADLAAIHRDLQVECARACRCAAAARALAGEARALRYLDDVVALLRGDVRAARARAWPFALGPRLASRNYIV